MTKICPNCEEPFEPHTYNQKYCCLKCQLLEAKERNKEYSKTKYDEAKEKEAIVFPLFICSHCGHRFELTFSPINNLHLLDALICPKCHKKAK